MNGQYVEILDKINYLEVSFKAQEDGANRRSELKIKNGKE